MARFQEVVDECLEVAEAFADISSSTFNELGAINFEDNDKVYPFFLFDKRSITGAINKFTRTNLPQSTTYTQTFYFFNTYDESEKTGTSLQTKIDELKLIADQYFAELRQRNQSGTNNFFLIDTPTFNAVDETHNNRVVQISYDVEIQTTPDNCGLGSFTYAGVEQPTTLIETANTDTTISMSWVDNATAETAYEVWRSTDCVNYTLLATLAANSTTHQDTGLTAETTYIYKVRAINASANGKFSNILVSCTTGVAASGTAYQRNYFTLQTTSYADYDDGYQLANGGYAFTEQTNIANIQQLDLTTDPLGLTLKYNNSFGNKVRFTTATGTTPSPVDGQYIIDNLTGLGYWDYDSGAITWDNIFGSGGSLKAFNDAGTGGYADFFNVNVNIVIDITSQEQLETAMLPYQSTITTQLWTSTTRGNSTTRAEYKINYGGVLATNKTTAYRMLPCRVHF